MWLFHLHVCIIFSCLIFFILSSEIETIDTSSEQFRTMLVPEGDRRFVALKTFIEWSWEPQNSYFFSMKNCLLLIE